MMAKRILVPVEMNERAEAIVPLVAALARDGGATVRLLNVQPVPATRFHDATREWPLYAYDTGGAVVVPERVFTYGHTQESRIESEALAQMRELEPLLDGVALERTVRFGDVVDEIVREAEAFDADLVALSERARPWWRPALARIVGRLRARLRVPVLALSGATR
jgi:nucleotide-binding universal stress UspA family protein